MSYFIICLVAFLGSALTLFSGFGLGTLLIPAFGLFFPIEITIALTAIVHFLNNIFKVVLLGKYADKRVVLRFGIPSIVAAFGGAFLLAYISGLEPLGNYELLSATLFISPVKLTIGILLIFFALFDVVPALKNIEFSEKFLPLGGLLSGFFGGLSGNQGALRTAFLIRAGLSKEVFIGSGIVIACFTDIARLSVYTNRIFPHFSEINISLLIAATLSAFAGAWLGNRFLKKVTIKMLHLLVGVMLLIFGSLLALGII